MAGAHRVRQCQKPMAQTEEFSESVTEYTKTNTEQHIAWVHGYVYYICVSVCVCICMVWYAMLCYAMVWTRCTAHNNTRDMKVVGIIRFDGQSKTIGSPRIQHRQSCNLLASKLGITHFGHAFSQIGEYYTIVHQSLNTHALYHSARDEFMVVDINIPILCCTQVSDFVPFDGMNWFTAHVLLPIFYMYTVIE